MRVKLVRIRCLTRGCQWVGWMDQATGHLANRRSEDEWTLTPCPRCRGTRAEYADRVRS